MKIVDFIQKVFNSFITTLRSINRDHLKAYLIFKNVNSNQRYP